VDSTGATLDFLLSAKQDAAAAKLAVFAGNQSLLTGLARAILLRWFTRFWRTKADEKNL